MDDHSSLIQSNNNGNNRIDTNILSVRLVSQRLSIITLNLAVPVLSRDGGCGTNTKSMSRKAKLYIDSGPPDSCTDQPLNLPSWD